MSFPRVFEVESRRVSISRIVTPGGQILVTRVDPVKGGVKILSSSRRSVDLVIRAVCGLDGVVNSDMYAFWN